MNYLKIGFRRTAVRYIKTALCTLTLCSFTILVPSSSQLSSNLKAQKKNKAFTVVLDAGHGGKDAGTVGSKITNKEKDIVLDVTLKVGKLLKEKCKDINVLYTRDGDYFVELDKRARIANKAKADLFVSIHVNSVESRSSRPMGVQAYTLTLKTAAVNLEIEKRENSVIQYEANGAAKYAFANAKSSESDIMFELMQDRDMQESVNFAKLAQSELVNTGKRKDMGVLQANLAVLRLTYMPSVLLELGFICNPAEERFMMSRQGREILAKCIFNAISIYKSQRTGKMSSLEKIDPQEIRNVEQLIEKNNVTSSPVETAPKESDQSDKASTENIQGDNTQTNSTQVSTSSAGNTNATSKENNSTSKSDSTKSNYTTPKAVEKTQPVAATNENNTNVALVKESEVLFKVQILTSPKKLAKGNPQLKGYAPEFYIEGKAYKYTHGSSTNYTEIAELKNKLKASFPQCFVIAIKDGKRIDTATAINDWKRKNK